MAESETVTSLFVLLQLRARKEALKHGRACIGFEAAVLSPAQLILSYATINSNLRLSSKRKYRFFVKKVESRIEPYTENDIQPIAEPA